jgi:hypothetical protein
MPLVPRRYPYRTELTLNFTQYCSARHIQYDRYEDLTFNLIVYIFFSPYERPVPTLYLNTSFLITNPTSEPSLLYNA